MASSSLPSKIGMKYRFLGDSGLLVSTFAYGCMTFTDHDQVDSAYELLTHAYAHGVNFWDNAEAYTNGVSESVVGQALHRGIANNVWTRADIVLATKIYAGTTQGPNAGGLSRKHLVEGTRASLQRLGTDYVDVLFCHRPEKYTPIEETVRAMNFIIDQGWAFYWGTSEWQATDILEACAVADRLGLVRPIVEQTRYNLFARSKVEVEFAALYTKYKLGLTTFSPLAYGVLTGKYATGTPADSRMTQELFKQALCGQTGAADVDAVIAMVEKLRPVAQELGCSMAQLALAWTASNENVSTVLLGAKTIAQLDENLMAFPFVGKITPEIKQRMEEIVPFQYKAPAYDGNYTMRGQYL